MSGHGTPMDDFLDLDDVALEQALDRRFGGAEIAADSDLDAFAEVCRTALAPELKGCGASAGSGGGSEEAWKRGSEALRARRVSARVLARSTREDLRRRGDLGLVVDFVSERLRQSALLRVAAALLVAQLTIVPLLAALHLSRVPEDPTLHLTLEPAPEMVDILPEREGDLIVEGGAAQLDEGIFDEDFAVKLRAILPMDLAAGARSEVGRALSSLEAVLHGSSSTQPRESEEALAIWAELEARLVLWSDRGRSAGLARCIDDATEALESATRDECALLASALERARSLHLAVAPLSGAILDEEISWTDALSSALVGIEDPVAARWRRALLERGDSPKR